MNQGFFTYRHTIAAAFIAYITQAIVNNFAPLLFLTFQQTYALSVEQITMLITFNFLSQLVTDVVAARYVDRLGYRGPTVAAHLLCAGGLVGLGVFPHWFPTPFSGFLFAIFCYAVGGGMIEVLISPIVEACPTQRKSAVMSLLHSFFCWGQVAVILLSTIFFHFFGLGNWELLACLWAAIPALNAILFAQVPILTLTQPEEACSFRSLFSNRVFWYFAVLMLCAGASELTMSQWASAFAESGLGVSKALGDLAGPCAFAFCMGCARLLYALCSARMSLRAFMLFCGALCLCSYLLASLSPSSVVALLGCALCGFSVGIMWPGTFSLAAKRIPRGGTGMFGLLALAGDLGCATGPTLIGLLAASPELGLKRALLFGAVFPLVLCVSLARGRSL